MNMSGGQVRAGLRDDEFVPFFQPVVTLPTGEVAGVEVLARWQHGTLGIVPPGAFIATAEQEGLIGELTAMLMGKAFAAAGTLPDPQWLAINISPHLLRDLALPKRIREAAEAAAFPLNRVVIEITESALVEHLGNAQTISRELKAQGCRLALDDFGTGYSSLLHLQSLPFDELKVDRSFVGSMTERRESRKIVSAVVGLGQSLGLATIAEGVETEEQAEMLLLLGCEMGQGLLFGKPVPAEQLSDATIARAPVKLRLTSNFWRDISYNSPPGQRLSHLQALYEGAPVGLAFLSPDLRYVSINQQLAEMNDAPVQKHLGRRVSEMIPAVYPQIEPHLRRALAGESVTAVEITQPATERRQRRDIPGVVSTRLRRSGRGGGHLRGGGRYHRPQANGSGTAGERRSLPPHGGVEPADPMGARRQRNGHHDQSALAADHGNERRGFSRARIHQRASSGRSEARGGSNRTFTPHRGPDRCGMPRPDLQRRVALDSFARSSAAERRRKDHPVVRQCGRYRRPEAAGAGTADASRRKALPLLGRRLSMGSPSNSNAGYPGQVTTALLANDA